MPKLSTYHNIRLPYFPSRCLKLHPWSHTASNFKNFRHHVQLYAMFYFILLLGPADLLTMGHWLENQIDYQCEQGSTIMAWFTTIDISQENTKENSSRELDNVNKNNAIFLISGLDFFQLTGCEEICFVHNILYR